jgi:hypothetical protein
LLGDDYPGYYPVGDESALAALLYQSETMPRFYASLQQRIHSRKECIEPAREKQSIQELMSGLVDS